VVAGVGTAEAAYGGIVLAKISGDPLRGRGAKTINTSQGPLASSQNPGDTKQYVKKRWFRGTFNSELDSAAYHLNKHGGGMTIQEYTRMAQDFFKRNWRSGEIVKSYDGTMDLFKINIKDGGMGIFTGDGQVVTFQP
jgi:hypothetical protein